MTFAVQGRYTSSFLNLVLLIAACLLMTAAHAEHSGSNLGKVLNAKQPHFIGDRALLSTPTRNAVLDTSVVQHGAGAAAAAAQQQTTAAEVRQLSSQLSSFRLRKPDLNVAFLPKQV
jgi:hypothetical protein